MILLMNRAIFRLANATNVKQGRIVKLMAELSSTGSKRPLEGESDIASKRVCDAESGERIKNRKYAVLLGYCGHGYLGMQRNHGYKTIEEDLMTALFKANLITPDSYNIMQNIHFQRAARTDKGVSAVRQVVSLKLAESSTIEEINAHLPEVIRVFALKRVTKGFNSKTSCDARTYSYTLPSTAFSTEDDTNNYRITPEVKDKINDALQVFTGTHNFHNFTSRKKAQDPSAFRYILNFECGEAFVSNGLELITLKVKGQSFMLHQIRKMVGTVIAIVRGLTTKETILNAWGEDRIDLPMAPGLGLVLEQVHYDRYNTKFGSDGMHERLTWDEFESDIEEFKKKYILPVIVQTELEERSMLTWIETLSLHSFGVRERHLHDTTKEASGGSSTVDSDVGDENSSSVNNSSNADKCETVNGSVSSPGVQVGTG